MDHADITNSIDPLQPLEAFKISQAGQIFVTNGVLDQFFSLAGSVEDERKVFKFGQSRYVQPGIILPDACLVIDYVLDIFTEVIKGLQVYPQRMKKNMDITRGLLFSQRVLVALIDKGLSRQEAYKLVQRNAMKSWKGNKRFLNLLKADSEVVAVLPTDELESLFDYQYYLRHVDEIFERLGLTEAQWKDKIGRTKPGELAPRSM